MFGMFSALAMLLREVIVFVSYIKNNAFPQPLSEKEEEEHLKRMAQGDKEARNALIEHNLRLVAHIVKKFENTGEATEDLISIGTIGLIKAIESFQPDKGTKLATYAARCIENENLMSTVMHKNWPVFVKAEESRFQPSSLRCSYCDSSGHGQTTPTKNTSFNPLY